MDEIPWSPIIIAAGPIIIAALSLYAGRRRGVADERKIAAEARKIDADTAGVTVATAITATQALDSLSQANAALHRDNAELRREFAALATAVEKHEPWDQEITAAVRVLIRQLEQAGIAHDIPPISDPPPLTVETTKPRPPRQYTSKES